ncbi:uncharacterized protein VTP21DRAFT_2927 [Calcarisporiella thermophila]|uniref:uncharacterized protein n=1 Tax=Calcarisporiella thermophila TaxID=911321 RepID=UPI003744425C
MSQLSYQERSNLVKSLKKKTLNAVAALRTVADFLEETNNILPQIFNYLYEDAHAVAPKRKRDIDPNAPKKPNTAYILFSNEVRPKIKAEFPDADQKQIVTIIGERWKQLPQEQRKVFEKKYMEGKERYDAERKMYLANQEAEKHPHELEEEEEEEEEEEISAQPPPSKKHKADNVSQKLASHENIEPESSKGEEKKKKKRGKKGGADVNGKSHTEEGVKGKEEGGKKKKKKQKQ